MEYRKLTRAEEDIMKVVWKKDRAAVSIGDILTGLRETKKPDYARTTLVTILSKIIEKGYAVNARNGKNAYVYPKVTYDEYRKMVMKDMVDSLYDGDVAKAQMFLSELAQ